MSSNARREAATYRGASGAYYGFTVFALDETLPRAAGLFALAMRSIGPERWRVLLIGETANFAAHLSKYDCKALAEARRRGATHVLLHVSAIATAQRREAGHDLWRKIRTPLVAWESDDIRRNA